MSGLRLFVCDGCGLSFRAYKNFLECPVCGQACYAPGLTADEIAQSKESRRRRAENLLKIKAISNAMHALVLCVPVAAVAYYAGYMLGLLRR